MLYAIRVIARARLLIARNTFWRGKIGRKIGVILVALLLGLAGFALYGLMYGAVSLVTSPRFLRLLQQAAAEEPGLGIPTDFLPFLDALPAIALFGALIVLLLTSFSGVLSALYLSGDIDALLVAPVPMRAVFVVKFFGALALPYLLLFVLLGPALVGYGQGRGFGPAFYVVLAPALALFPLLPAGLAALLVMAVVRVIPARRAREIVGVLGGLFGVIWYVGSQFSRSLLPQMATVSTFDSLRRFDNPLLPSAWASRAMLAAGTGQWGELLLYGGLFAAASLGFFAGCLVLAERLYYAGWSNMAIQGGRVRRRAEQRTAGAGRSPLGRLVAAVLPPESAAILYKDLRLFPRDLRNIQQFLFPLGIAVFWTISLLGGGRSVMDDAPPELAGITSLGTLGIGFYVCWVLSSAMGGASISREGRGLWQLKVAPISAWRLMLGKLVLAYLPYPTIGALFVLVLSVIQGQPALEALRLLALLLLIGLGVTSISLGLGAAYPRLDWENPTQQTSGRAGCLGSLLGLGYLVLAAGVALGLPAAAVLLPDLATLLTVLGWALFLALTALVVWGVLYFGAGRLEQLEI